MMILVVVYVGVRSYVLCIFDIFLNIYIVCSDKSILASSSHLLIRLRPRIFSPPSQEEAFLYRMRHPIQSDKSGTEVGV